MGDFQFTEEMKDNARHVNGKLEVAKTWIRTYKWQLTFATLTLLVLTATLSVSAYQQSQLESKFKVLEEVMIENAIRNVGKLEKLEDRIRSNDVDQGIPLESCIEYADYRIVDKGEFLIDPDGYGGYDPFHVTCEFYNSMIVTKVFQKSSNAPSEEQLESLIRNSSQCKQEIDFFYCKASILTNKEERRKSWWN